MGITFILPITFGMPPIPSMALLLGLYIEEFLVGLTAILINYTGYSCLYCYNFRWLSDGETGRGQQSPGCRYLLFLSRRHV
jgi:TctA family transporter